MQKLVLLLLILNFEFFGKKIKSLSAVINYEKIKNNSEIVFLDGNAFRVTLLCPCFEGDFNMNKLRVLR